MRLFLILLLSAISASALRADDSEFRELKTKFGGALLEIDILSSQRLTELQKNYRNALTRIETELQRSGELDGVLAIQQEKASPGEGTASSENWGNDPAADMRKVYQQSFAEIQADRNADREEKSSLYLANLKPMLATLTEQNRIEEAAAVQQEIERVQTLKESSPTKPPEETGTGIERFVALETERPPVSSDPFAENQWKEAMTVPAGDYRLRANISIGSHNSGTKIYLEPGGNYTRHEGKIHVYGGRLISDGCSFSDIPFRADHSGGMHFYNSRLKDCNTAEQGNWWGSGNYDSKWYFENCLISGNFFGGTRFNVNHYGLCVSRCSFDRVELPEVWYKETEPVVRREDKWLTVENCHFEKCKIPLSFLMITKNCTFVDCRFEDNKANPPNLFEKPIEVIFYTSQCTNAIRKASATVTLTEKPIGELKVPVGSILEED